MGDVPPLTRFTDAVSLDGAGQDHGWLSGVPHRGVIGGIDLHRIVAAQGELLQPLVRQVLHHLEEPRVDAPEMLADVGAAFGRVFLVLAVHDLAHAPDQQAVVVLLEQRIPFAAPDHFDDVPPGAAEDRLELVDDLSVPPHRSIEALQVAVDDEDEVVELLAGGQGDRTERLGFIGFTVADKRPDLGIGPLLQPAVFQIPHEARLVDGTDGPEPHRHGGKFPEVGHQPRVRIG